MTAEIDLEAATAAANTNIPRGSRIALYATCLLAALGRGRHSLRKYDENLFGHFPQPTPEGVIFAACDERYFYRFAKSLVASLAEHSPAQSVHLHVYEPSEACLADMRAFQRHGPHPSLTFTWDEPGLDRYPAYRGLYFASARFVRLHQLAEACRSNVFSMDVDAVVRRSLFPLFAEAAEKDVGLLFRPTVRKSWRKILASAVFISATPAGRRFARDVAASIAMAQPYRPTFHIDQLVLLYLSRLYRTLSPSSRFLWLSQGAADWEYLAESYVWSAKGSRKLADQPFVEAVAANTAAADVLRKPAP